MSECIFTIKHIRNSQKLSAVFKMKQQTNEGGAKTTLKLPVKTRWGSTVHCLNSLQVNKLPLQTLAIDDAVKEYLSGNVKTTILSEIFWDKVSGFLMLLKPIADAILSVEGDKQSMSSVMKIFQDLEKGFEQNIPASPVLKAEEKQVKEIFMKRKDFCINKVHYAANLLDPNYKGIHLTQNEIVDAFEEIHNIATHMPDIDESAVMGELADYRSQQKIFSKSFIWKAIDHTTPTAWWTGLCGSTNISKLAAGVLNLPPTSAAVERSFSKHANIHSLKRNKLTNERAAKLVYIAHNLKLTESDAFSSQGHTSKIVPGSLQHSIKSDTQSSEDNADSEIEISSNDNDSDKNE